jgi:hypothetical protein
MSPFWRYALLPLIAVVLLRIVGDSPSLAHEDGQRELIMVRGHLL